MARQRRVTRALVMLVGLVTVVAMAGSASALGDTWEPRAPMPTPHYAGVAGAIGGRLYVFGGHDGGTDQGLVVYDPATNTWTPSVAPVTLVRHAAAGVIDGKLYVAGGLPSPTLLQAYDPLTDTWTTKAPMPHGRVAGAAAAVGGKLYVVGGGPSEVDVYDPATDGWTTPTALPTPRDWLAAAASGGTLYVLGGTTTGGITEYVGTLEAYDPVPNLWTTKTPMPTARNGLAVGVINGRLHAIGGSSATGGTLDTHEVYDPATDMWSARAAMPTGRTALVAGVLGSRFYAAGGQIGDGSITALVEAYDPGGLAPGDIVVVDASAFGTANGNNGKVIKVDPATGAQTLISSGGVLADPWKVAIDAAGNILVVDAMLGDGGQVVKVDPVTGAQTVVSSGGSLVEPTGIAVAANGDILVADFQSGGGAVIKVDPGTGAQTVLCTGGAFFDPRGIALTPAGEILVADIDAFNYFGGVIRVEPGAAPPGTCVQTQVFKSADANAGPAGIAVAANGDILVADLSAFGGSGGVIRIDPLTGAATTVSQGGFFADPEGIAVEGGGGIVVGDSTAAAVIRVDPATGAQTVLAAGGFLVHPIGVAVVPIPPDGILGPAGGTVVDEAGTGAAFSVGPGVLPPGTSVAIEVIPDPGVASPPGFVGPATLFVSFTLTPDPSPLPSPGATLTLPLASGLPPGTTLALFEFDPATGLLADTGIVGAVDPGGATATFTGVTGFSVFAAFQAAPAGPDVAVARYGTRGPNLPGMCSRRGCVAEKTHTVVVENRGLQAATVDVSIRVDAVPGGTCTVNGAGAGGSVTVASGVGLAAGARFSQDIGLQFACAPASAAFVGQTFQLRAHVETPGSIDPNPANNDSQETQRVR